MERDLLAFLLVASFEEEDMIFGAITRTIRQVKRFLEDKSESARAAQDLDYELRKDELATALFNCGIPWWICKRNAAAFMCLRKDFDLNSPKYRRIKQLLEHHQTELLNAYFSIGEQHGRQAADAWINYIRSQDIWFARIVALPDDISTRYLFGS